MQTSPDLLFSEQTKPSEITRRSTVKALFGQGPGEASRFEQYFAYYDRQIRLLQIHEVNLPGWVENSSAINTHADMLNTLGVLRECREVDRKEMRDQLRERLDKPKSHVSDYALNWAIAVTLRLCLLVNIPDEGNRNAVGHSPIVEWKEEEKLDEFLKSLFPAPEWVPTPEESRHDANFTAAFMVDVCGLKIRWTDSLQEHLRFNHRRRKLAVFSHKKYMQALLKSPQDRGKTQCCLWPRVVLEETIDSLLLLFPTFDRRTDKIIECASLEWPGIAEISLRPCQSSRKIIKKLLNNSDRRSQELFKAAKQNIVDVLPREAGKCREIGDFHYWRDRLLALHQEVYRSPPESWRQIFHDNRNQQQYWTFMFALIILVLTVISTTAGIVSMGCGIVSMKIAQQEASAPQETVVCECNMPSFNNRSEKGF